jgi:hypothetical protein
MSDSAIRSALRIEFASDRFDMSGPLADDSNAGNLFYGEDLCRWLREALPQWSLDYLDEDWGWLLGSDRRTVGDVPVDHQICVYAYPPGTQDQDGNTTDSGEWMLVLHKRERRPWLRVFKRWVYTDADLALAADVIAALRGIDARDLRASVLRMDAAGNEIETTPYVAQERTP